MLPLLLAAALLLGGVVYEIAWRTVAWHKLRGFPAPPYGWLAHVWMPGQPPERQTSWAKAHLGRTYWAEKLGGIYRTSAGATGSVLVVSDAEAVAVVAKAAPQKPTALYGMLAFTGTYYPTLFTLATGADWRTRRKAFSHPFSRTMMRRRADTVRGLVKEMAGALERLVEEGPREVDMDVFFSRLTVDVIMALAFGFDIGATRGEDGGVCEALHTIVSPDAMLQMFYPIVRLASWWEPVKKVTAARALVRETARKMYTDFIARYEEADDETRGSMDETFMGRLYMLERSDATITRDHVHQEMIFLTIAGSDTTSHSAYWACMLFAKHPQHLARAREEIASEGRDGQLPFLEACLKEAARLWPAAAGGGLRVTENELELYGGAVRIPKGTTIHLANHTIHRFSRNWGEDALEFKPERFLGYTDAAWYAAGATPGESSSFAFTNFGVGVRNCIGMQLSILELREILVEVLPRFDFALPHDAPAEYEGVIGLTLRPENPRLLVSLRS